MTINNNAPHVTIEPAPVAGVAWRCEEVRHLPPGENKGKHNIFLAVYRAGALVRDGSVKVIWGWNGQSDEPSPPVLCDKSDSGYCADIPIFKNQHIWLKIDDGRGTLSDVVRNLHADLPSDGEGNSQWHHSYFLKFEVSIGLPEPLPPMLQATLEGLAERVAELESQMQQVLSAVQVKALPGDAKG